MGLLLGRHFRNREMNKESGILSRPNNLPDPKVVGKQEFGGSPPGSKGFPAVPSSALI